MNVYQDIELKGDGAVVQYKNSSNNGFKASEEGLSNVRGNTEYPTLDESESTKLWIGNRLYPVDAIYTSTNSTDPGELFGGSWEPISSIGADETASLIMTETSLSSSSFSFTRGSGTVTSNSMYLRYNDDYSIIQLTGRFSLTVSSTSYGGIGIKFNIGSNIIKKNMGYIICGYCFDSSGAYETLYADVSTNGNITIYNTSTYINISSSTAWPINLILFNKTSDGATLYRWQRIN